MNLVATVPFSENHIADNFQKNLDNFLSKLTHFIWQHVTYL